jgi:hypothetical protein
MDYRILEKIPQTQQIRIEETDVDSMHNSHMGPGSG